MVRVLFVCLGNICRSPMAEGVFQHLVKAAGLADQIVIDSAGTSSYHVGESAHRGTLKVLNQNNISYDGRARNLVKKDFENFDYILAMDSENLKDILRIKPDHATPVIRRFLEYADNPAVLDVPDPYYTGGFDEVYALVKNAAEGLLKDIRTRHQL